MGRKWASLHVFLGVPSVDVFFIIPRQDIAFVLYYIVFFSWCRECLAIYLLKPVARHYGVRRLAKVDRFAEQGYAVIYFTAAGSLGLVRSPSLPLSDDAMADLLVLLFVVDYV
jgi:very-long-chain ceramide synthase